MKKIIFFLFISAGAFNAFAQKHIGINTSTPLASLHVADSSVLFSGPATLPITATPPPVSGAGIRMMWYADNAAFRAGGVSNANWDKVNVGQYSFATGFNTKASGFGANAMGIFTTASGSNSLAIGSAANATGPTSVAMGNSTTASGNSSTATGYFSIAGGDKSFAAGDSANADGYAAVALGYRTLASGDFSTSTGYNSEASGQYATAIGSIDVKASGYASTAIGSYATWASGFASVAIGTNVQATGTNCLAMGDNVQASGSNSYALGNNCSTNNHTNSFCISGAPGGLFTSNSTDNQMMMRFDNYTFWVSPSSYAYLVPASNGWAYTSDKNKKEKFEELNGEAVLNKISTIPFYSWNFKAKDVQPYRHYGIMAQDFYNAFGKDSYGTIGNDTTVSPLDLLGVAYSGIKALEKRSTTLANENAQLKADNIALQNKIDKMEQQFAEKNTVLADKLALLETKLNNMAVPKLSND